MAACRAGPSWSRVLKSPAAGRYGRSCCARARLCFWKTIKIVGGGIIESGGIPLSRKMENQMRTKMEKRWGTAGEALMTLRGKLSNASKRKDAARLAILRQLYRDIQSEFRRY